MESVDAEAPEEPIPPRPLAKFFGLMWAATGLLTIFTYWQQPLFLNLASSFRLQLLILLTILSVPPMILFSGRVRLLFPAIPLLISGTFLSYFVVPPLDVSGPQLQLALSNIYTGNRNLGKLQQWLKQQPVDILGILEVGDHHVEALQEMGFEHTLVEARQNNFGIAYFSREKPLQLTLLESESSTPSIWAEYENYQVLVTHPVPPVNSQARAHGDQQMVRLMKSLDLSKPVILMGDFNATGWDLRIQELTELGLKETRKGHGILPTWPVGRPIMYIPIDHIYVPENWSTLACEVGPDIGSDHFPIRATVQLP